MLIPQMGDTGIGHQVRIPLVSRVRHQHVEPHGVHPYPRGWILLENLLLYPPGTGAADSSGWRYEQNDANQTIVLGEERLELLH